MTPPEAPGCIPPPRFKPIPPYRRIGFEKLPASHELHEFLLMEESGVSLGNLRVTGRPGESRRISTRFMTGS
ncbi:MAG: hypothetical protein LBR93_08615 [Treponema sp.]|nr:hypothetical protein [Treponema sp.]